MNSRGKGIKQWILKRAADIANAKSRSRANRAGVVIKDIGIISDGDAETAFYIEEGFPGGLELHNVVSRGTRSVVVVGQGSGDRKNDGESSMKVSISGESNVVGGHTGISVPNDSSTEIAIGDKASVSGGVYGINERDAIVDELKKILPPETPHEAIEDALDAVRKVKGGTQEEKEEAVRGSRLREWIKEYGGDVVGLVVKAAQSMMS
ncbi:hypothetical protein SY91_02124 [Burkholderia cenocepacia]|uniref:hypothetical protein n=1 Tax=Burkholderia cenocepacia TaxID=95486 RepID=UPI00163C57F4|nr:hypothetical protein [Burkholderia cenocepacia]QND94714.1 hypothetical protein SY91_02124 [Burkholderia cenocepacia]